MRFIGLCLALFVAATAGGEEIIWEGKSGGYRWKWSTQEISAIQDADGSTVFSTKEQYSESSFDPKTYRFEEEGGNEEEMECEYDQNFALLSVVGPYATYSDSQYDFCIGAAHPNSENIWMPLDLRKQRDPEKENLLELTDLFPESEVFNALKSDSYVQEALDTIDSETPPENLRELVSVLVSELGCEYGFDDDMLSRFAFHHVDGNQVAIRLGISNRSAHVCNKGITELGLLLKIPPPLRDDLLAAERMSAGFLMKDLKKIAGTKTASVHFESPGPISFRYGIHSELPDYYFIILGKYDEAGLITVKQIRVNETYESLPPQLTEEMQTLDVMGKMEPRAREDVSIFVEDLNFDGYLDIGLETRQEKEEASYDYWLYDRASSQFRYLGNYPHLTPNPKTQDLEDTREVVYRFVNGNLTRVKP